MPPGKAASQAGHAFLDSFLKASPDITNAYHSDGCGTKVVLLAPDEVTLRQIHLKAQDLGIPCALITDSGHVMPPHFDGSPVVTALGLGPITREIANCLTRELKLMP